MAKTTDKKLTLEELKLFKAEAQNELESLKRTGLFVEDVLSSIDFFESLKDRELDKDSLKTFKTVRKEALKVQGALPVLIAFQTAFVKTCGAVLDEVSPRKSRPSFKASRATTKENLVKFTINELDSDYFKRFLRKYPKEKKTFSIIKTTQVNGNPLSNKLQVQAKKEDIIHLATRAKSDSKLRTSLGNFFYQLLKLANKYKTEG